MKKLYKNAWMLLMAVLCAFTFAACQETDIDSQPTAAPNIQIGAMETYTAFATAPNNVVFSVSSNTPWKITSDQPWCVVTPNESAVSSLVSEVVVKLENNLDKYARTAKLTIEAEGVEKQTVVTINQVSKEVLGVNYEENLVPYEGGEVKLTIQSNKPWEIEYAGEFLSNIDVKSSEGTLDATNEVVTVTLPKNLNVRRSGELVVKTAFEKKVFTVQQDGIFQQEANPESADIAANGGNSEQIIKFLSNTAWTPEVPSEFQSWMTVEKLNDNELKVITKRNNRLSTRTGKVILKSTENIQGFEGVAFNVNQKADFWFNISASQIVKDEATGNVKVIGANNAVVSNFRIQKGSIVYEFADLNITNTGRLVFNLWQDEGSQANFHFWLRSDKQCQFTCGGGYQWQQVKFKMTPEEVNAVRKVEFRVEDNPDHAGKLLIRLLVNDVEKGVLGLKSLINDVYLNNPAANPGQASNLGLFDGAKGHYFTVKSITYNPAE